MNVDCLAFSKDAVCSVVTGPDNPGGTAIAGSVGAGGANISADVRTIQAALNDVPGARGGAIPSLAVDGIVGPKSLAAITTFQRARVSIVDSRVDPHGPTLAALNAELDVVDASPVSPASATVGGPPRRGRRTPEFLPPDPEIVAAAVALLAVVRRMIRAANFRLLSADPFVGAQKLTIPTGPFTENARQSLNILDTVFNLGKFRHPRLPFDNIKLIFRNMDVALNRSFETAPLIAPILFVPNTHISMEAKAGAYTAQGGAFLDSTAKFNDLPDLQANRIYVCRNFLTASRIDQTGALVHELAHYVSAKPNKVTDIVHRGRMVHRETRPPFDAIRPEQKIRSAEHYSFFAHASLVPGIL